MLNHFERLSNKGVFAKQPQFNRQIEELVSETRRQIGFNKFRDRSKTDTFQGTDFNKLRADSILEEKREQTVIGIPINNPLFNIGQINLNKVSEKK